MIPQAIPYPRQGRSGYRTALLRPHTIYYRFDQETLTVYRILHQRKDMDGYTFLGI